MRALQRLLITKENQSMSARVRTDVVNLTRSLLRRTLKRECGIAVDNDRANCVALRLAAHLDQYRNFVQFDHLTAWHRQNQPHHRSFALPYTVRTRAGSPSAACIAR